MNQEPKICTMTNAWEMKRAMFANILKVVDVCAINVFPICLISLLPIGTYFLDIPCIYTK